MANICRNTARRQQHCARKICNMLFLLRILCVESVTELSVYNGQLMTGWTKIRLRPIVSLVTEYVPRCPMMIFSAIGAAYFAFMSWPSRLNLSRTNSGRQDNLLRYEVGGSMTTVTHVKVLNRPALVLALCDLPRFIPATLWAWIVWPRKCLCNHRALLMRKNTTKDKSRLLHVTGRIATHQPSFSKIRPVLHGVRQIMYNHIGGAANRFQF